ncbi:helix-turn-helix transcriptional regulator [Thiolapillus sp.]|uniref:helix-turn-helix transcriptional regulator n=1 Tax=Thiolapillus sp. TaxID=2017437 RepID=UPI003AF962B2
MSRKSERRKAQARQAQEQARAQAELKAREEARAQAELQAQEEANKARKETMKRNGTNKRPKLKPITPSIQWLTTKETMTLAQTSRTTMYKKIKAGEFPQPIKIGKKSLWVESEIKDWIKNQTKLPTSIDI